MKKTLFLLLSVLMFSLTAVSVAAAETSFTIGTEEEKDFIYLEMGSIIDGDKRVNDGFGMVIYEFSINEGDKYAQISMMIRNQFEISVTTTDPDDDDTFDVVCVLEPTDEEIADGRASWGDYAQSQLTVIDLSEYCEDNDKGKIWVKVADADPSNGWGGQISNAYPVVFYSGAKPAGEVEQPKTPTEIATETLAGYTFTEYDQYFIVSTDYETPYIYKNKGAIDGDFNRFMDSPNYIIYMFDVKATDTYANLNITLSNQFDVRVATSAPDNVDGYTTLMTQQKNEEELADSSIKWWGGRREVYNIDLSSYLTGTDGKMYIYIGDCDPDGGWGGQVYFYNPVVFTSASKALAEIVTETPEAAPETEVELTVEPTETTEYTENVETKAPQTADPIVIAVIAAVSALSGTVVISKKRIRF